MAVDVTATGTIDRPCDEVAAFLRDPANDTTWIGGLRSVRLLTPGPVAVGSQVERVAGFLGRRVRYVNEITELTADRLAHALGPLTLPDAGDLRPPRRRAQHHRGLGAGRGRRRGFYALLRPLLALAVRRSITRDLGSLKQVLEAPSSRTRRG